MNPLDIPGPFLSWADGMLAAAVPSALRIGLWGALGGALSMAVYWLMSPQRRIAHVAEDERRLRRAMWSDDGGSATGLAPAWTLVRLALTRLGLVLLPVLVAALPVLMLISWLAGAYDGGRYLARGPDWIAGWEGPFFGALIAVSVLIKFAFRIR